MFGMEKHEEGGWFKLVAYSTEKVEKKEMVNQPVNRSALTSIYYLLTKEDFSTFHLLKSDEIWHYYDGETAVLLYEID